MLLILRKELFLLTEELTDILLIEQFTNILLIYTVQKELK